MARHRGFGPLTDNASLTTLGFTDLTFVNANLTVYSNPMLSHCLIQDLADQVLRYCNTATGITCTGCVCTGNLNDDVCP